MKKIKIGNFVAGDNKKFVLIAGPCVLENEKTAMDIARYLKKLTAKLSIPFIFKASYDKANRTSIKSYRGPGAKKGLAILEKIKGELNIPVLSDVHRAVLVVGGVMHGVRAGVSGGMGGGGAGRGHLSPVLS